MSKNSPVETIGIDTDDGYKQVEITEIDSRKLFQILAEQMSWENKKAQAQAIVDTLRERVFAAIRSGDSESWHEAQYFSGLAEDLFEATAMFDAARKFSLASQHLRPKN